MTATSPTAGRTAGSTTARIDPDALRLRLAPEEGWLTVALVTVLVLTVAWSFEDARWILGRSELTDFLPWVAILGVAWGFLGAKVGWSRPRTYLLGAVMAALVVPILVGAILQPDAGSIGGWFRVTAESSIEAYLDLAARNKVLTQEYGHFMLAIGLLVWGTGMFAAYATFGRHRPLNAVLVTGLVLLINMSLTVREQLLILVIFTIAALLVLIRVHAEEERMTWLRRRLGDPAAVSSLYVRGGSIFAAAAIGGALLLTSTAASNPLGGLWTDTQQSLIDFTQGIQRYLPRGGLGTKISGVSFGPQATITGTWVTDTSRALEIQVPPGDGTPYYWRAVAYDQFEGNGWSLSDSVTVDRAAGSAVLSDTSDAPLDPKARTPLTYTVHPLGYRGSTVFSPDAPDTVDTATRVALVGNGQYLGEVELAGGSQTYTVEALVRQIGDQTPGALTANRLRAAGQDYPDLIRGLYLDVPPGTVGPDLTALAQTIRSAAPLGDPYDLAKQAEQYLRSPIFTYDTDVSGLACGDRSIVECFAHFKRGYCQHYASTMTILMRMLGVPARFVEGFLPGQRDARTGTEIVLNSNSHAWVEVYFPGYGWVPFDPTGGGLAQLGALPSGAPVASASASPRPSGSSVVDNGQDPRRPQTGPSGTGTPTGRSAGGLAFVVVGLLLAVALGVLAFLAYRRGPRGASTPDAIFGSISRLAGRFGWARRPTETVYEYAGSLAEALPAVRPELETVARAKVEVAYAGSVLGADRLRDLRAAQQRVRVALLGLLFSRKRRRRG
jgi:hypothetical protein